jgi:chemotaxis protein CheC
MQIDVQSLETYNRLAREGARSASESLSQMTGIDTRVEVTDVSLMSPADLEYEFLGSDFSGVQIGLDGGLAGETVLLFEEAAKTAITETLAPGGDEAMARSSVKEIGNIMTSGFIDGWAEHLGTTIDITPPEYVDGSGPELVPDSILSSDDQVFVFRSSVEAPSREIDFRICLVPERAALTSVLGSENDDAISFEKLQVFNEMTKRGAEKAAGNITSMTGLETTVEVNRMSFVPISDVPSEVGDRRYVGTVTSYEGKPSGYLVILFDQPSAQSVVDALVPMETDDDGWGQMEQSAMKELGNIMTSGFIDGWANVLETSINHAPPQFVADMGSAITSPIVGKMARTQDHAFVLDSVIDTDSDGVFRSEIFALPDEAELREVLGDLLVDRAEQTHVEPDEVF